MSALIWPLTNRASSAGGASLIIVFNQRSASPGVSVLCSWSRWSVLVLQPNADATQTQLGGLNGQCQALQRLFQSHVAVRFLLEFVARLHERIEEPGYNSVLVDALYKVYSTERKNGRENIS